MWWISRARQGHFANHEGNRRLIEGLHSYLKTIGHVESIRLRPWTWWTAWKEKRRHQELEGPSVAPFPNDRLPFGNVCLCRVGPCPAWIRPTTSTVFGIRVGSYLNLLRLPEPQQSLAVEFGAAWKACPLPALRSINIAETFGPDWVVPNRLHPEINRFYERAYEMA